MQSKLLKIIGLLFILGLYSCEKIIPFDEEINQSKLVVNSTFFNDSFFKGLSFFKVSIIKGFS